MVKYRKRNNYCSGMYMFGRLFDKVGAGQEHCSWNMLHMC